MIRFSEQVMSNIRGAMEANDITQRMLACELLVTEQRVSQMLRVDSNLTLHTVDTVYDALHQIVALRPPRINWEYLNARQ